MVEVHGTITGVPYRVRLTGKERTPVEGSKRVAALVRAAIDRKMMVMAGPTGPALQVTAANPRSIVHLLAKHGHVAKVSGLPPQDLTVLRKPGVVL